MDTSEDFKMRTEERVRHLTDENSQLREKNEQLTNKLGDLQGKLGQLTGSKADQFSRVIAIEEEKLKVEKDLIEVQIQANKMREQYETEAFEMKNKILLYENQIMELEMHRDKIFRDLQSTKSCLEVAEKDHTDLAEEYINLKSIYKAMSEELEREMSRNEELSAELLGLAQEHSTRLKRGHSTPELGRVRSLVSSMSQSRIRPEKPTVIEEERKELDKNLLRRQEQIREEFEIMKQSYEGQQLRLEEKLVAMGKEQQDSKRAIRHTQQKVAEQSTALFTAQSQLKEVETENSKLQLQLKELNEEYRSRLVRYMRDLSEYMDGNGTEQGTKKSTEQEQVKKFMDTLLQDVRASYRSREVQLASAARGYKKKLQQVTRNHEALLIAYSALRDQILALNDHSLDPGPPESHFVPTDNELKVAQNHELHRLREVKASLEGQLKDALEQKTRRKTTLQAEDHSSHSVSFPDEVLHITKSRDTGNPSKDAWDDIRKELRQFTHSTLDNIEKERAQLITRATVAEEHLVALQEYVDKHLIRYKQEITRLRRLLGMETVRAHSAEETQRLLPRRARKQPSSEV